MPGLYLFACRIICFACQDYIFCMPGLYVLDLHSAESGLIIYANANLISSIFHYLVFYWIITARTPCAPFRFLILAVLVILAEWIFVKPESVLLPLFSIAQIWYHVSIIECIYLFSPLQCFSLNKQHNIISITSLSVKWKTEITLYRKMKNWKHTILRRKLKMDRIGRVDQKNKPIGRTCFNKMDARTSSSFAHKNYNTV